MSRKRLKEERSKKEGGTALSSFPEVVNGRFQERHAVQNANSLHSPFKSEDNILGQLSVQNRGVMIPDPESDFHFFCASRSRSSKMPNRNTYRGVMIPGLDLDLPFGDNESGFGSSIKWNRNTSSSEVSSFLEECLLFQAMYFPLGQGSAM